MRAVILRAASRGPQEVLVLGLLPRFNGQVMGTAWEKMASYFLERAMKKMIKTTRGRTRCSIQYVILGRVLTRKLMGCHSVREDCRDWYRPDEVRLSQAAYERVTDLLPIWLRFDL